MPRITVKEMCRALQKMRRNKCADRHSVVLEMLHHGGDSLHEVLMKLFNQILDNGVIPEEWADMIFVMLPKIGDTSDPKN